MDVKSRLTHLQSQAGAGSTTRQETVSRLRERIAQLERSRRNRPHPPSAGSDDPEAARASAVALRVGGDVIADNLIGIRKRIPLSGKLGSTPLHSLRNKPRLPGETAPRSSRNVYIDTETTGLSGGSGTLAFLAGIAVVDTDAVELTQFLLCGFGAEAAMLSALAGSVKSDDQLVSYNGKSYDLPLLATRFRMQGLAPALAPLAHLDLLHPVRRLFGRRWNDCRLVSLEKNLLGFSRVDDLPGSEAPAAWFSYLRCGDARQLARVVEHNQQDIVSLAVAHSTLVQVLERPAAFAADIHAQARWLAESDEQRARELLQDNIAVLCDDGKRLLACLARRAGDWRRATAIWEALAAAGCADSMERLAKYHEHVSKDLHAARRYCESLPRGAERDHRCRRVMQKLALACAPHRIG